MNNHVIKNLTDPLSNQDVATKNYVEKTLLIHTAGCVLSGDVKLNVGSDV